MDSKKFGNSSVINLNKWLEKHLQISEINQQIVISSEWHADKWGKNLGEGLQYPYIIVQEEFTPF